MRGRPIRVLLLLTLVPLLIVVVLLAIAALDGRGAERPRAPASTRSRAVTGTCGSTSAAASRARGSSAVGARLVKTQESGSI